MDLATLIFWIIAILLVGSALLVVTMRNIVHSALALVVLFAMASGIYLLLNAEFIAIVQILIYTGAVSILILFALMLTRTNNLQLNSNPTNKQSWLADYQRFRGSGHHLCRDCQPTRSCQYRQWLRPVAKRCQQRRTHWSIVIQPYYLQLRAAI